MRKGNKKLFKNKEKLNKLINLRINGYSLTSLAALFGCDYTSVEAWLWKYGIWNPEKDDEVINIERITSNLIKINSKEDNKWYIIDGERFNKGKSYEDYLKESQQRIIYPYRKNNNLVIK